MSAKACPKYALLIQGKLSPFGGGEREREGRERKKRGSQKTRLGPLSRGLGSLQAGGEGRVRTGSLSCVDLTNSVPKEDPGQTY